MGKLADHEGSDVIHGMLVGNNGSGKTGALAGLAAEGYKLRIADFDGGVEIIKNLLLGRPEMDNVDVESFQDEYHIQPISNMYKAKASKAFPRFINMISKWGEYGSPTTWGKDTVLVLDSGTFLGKACLNHVFDMKGKLKAIDKESNMISQPDWGDAMKLQEDVMAQLKMLPCHTLVTFHVTFLTPDGEVASQGFPSALGSKLPPKIGGHFNHLLHFTKQGVGANKQRGLSAKSTQLVETKTSAPGKVKDWYPLDPAHPLEGGLRQYFRDIRGPLK